jgi:hypothetical protein
MGDPHLITIFDEQKLCKMVASGGSCQMFASSQRPAFVQRIPAKAFVQAAAFHPRATPVVPGRDRARHILKIRQRDAVGHHTV